MNSYTSKPYRWLFLDMLLVQISQLCCWLHCFSIGPFISSGGEKNRTLTMSVNSYTSNGLQVVFSFLHTNSKSYCMTRRCINTVWYPYIGYNCHYRFYLFIFVIIFTEQFKELLLSKSTPDSEILPIVQQRRYPT